MESRRRDGSSEHGRKRDGQAQVSGELDIILDGPGWVIQRPSPRGSRATQWPTSAEQAPTVPMPE